ncbi:MAG: sugar phosphate nucleotidyltransferase [Prevotellaceae bacterium]|nr:sugar phosphate nucleotidyltransferase [Prevotellaceae bacterium]
MNKDIKELFVPGRLCLFGEHSDWAGKYRTMNADIVAGAAIVSGIEQGIYATVERDSHFSVISTAPEITDIWQDFSCRMDSHELKEVAKSGSFFCYCAGVASYMLEWYKVGGVKITITKMTLPIKSGLSSSAAICVLVARAFNLMYNLNLSTMGEMNIAYWGELRTSSRCGRLDQACAFGVHPVLMTFDAEEVEVKNFNIKETLHWVFSDLNGQKDTIKILTDLNKAFPFAEGEREKNVQYALGELNQKTVKEAIRLMEDGQVEELGRLMTQAQADFDKYITPMCPSQLTSPKLHNMLADERVKALTYGGKGVGSHGDGSVQFLAKSKECQNELVEYLKLKGLHAYGLTIEPKHTIRKAIIPVAGFGTRLYPETRFLKKDFFPIIDKDGQVKPLILILLEECKAAGIEEVCIVLGSREEREQYRQFFETPLPKEHLDKLPKEKIKYERHILDIGKRLTYVYQTEKKGFGDAVYRCVDFAANEPVLLLLGDTIYRSNTNKCCALQFIEAFEKYNKPMMSIHEIPLEKVCYYGVTSGKWIDSKEHVLNMSNITEKPSSAYAEENLGVSSLTVKGAKRYYCAFGSYILTKEVFAQLKDNINNNVVNAKGEVELTTALEQVRQQNGLLGVILDGQMFDIGVPNEYRNTMYNFASPC